MPNLCGITNVLQKTVGLGLLLFRGNLMDSEIVKKCFNIKFKSISYVSTSVFSQYPKICEGLWGRV